MDLTLADEFKAQVKHTMRYQNFFKEANYFELELYHTLAGLTQNYPEVVAAKDFITHRDASRALSIVTVLPHNAKILSDEEVDQWISEVING